MSSYDKGDPFRMHRRDRPIIMITTGSNNYTDRRGSPATDWVVSDLYAKRVDQAGGLGLAVGPLKNGERESERLEAICRTMNGLLLTGGAFDIPPDLYGAPVHPKSGPFNHPRTQLELDLLRAAIRDSKPVLGICGGMQLLNVAFGGTLTQDLSLLKAPLQHEQSEPRSEVGHDVEILRNTLLADVIGSSQLGVNSTHHQVIGDLGSDLVVSASASDGVVEAIESKSHPFIMGVQWHPEAMAVPEQQRLFERFVSEAMRLA